MVVDGDDDDDAWVTTLAHTDSVIRALTWDQIQGLKTRDGIANFIQSMGQGRD